MKFRTQFEDYKAEPSCAGDPVKIIYAGHYDEQGHFDLVEKGKENLYDYIQSHADSVDIHVLMSQYQNGNEAALNKVSGVFGDFTEVPNTYVGMLNMLIDKEQEFMALDPEIRAKFDNSFNTYMATAGSEAWFKALGFVKDNFTEETPDNKPDNKPVENPEVSE